MFSEVANSVVWIFTSKPASLLMACTTRARRCASEAVVVTRVKLGLLTPASFKSARARSTLRLGTGTPLA